MRGCWSNPSINLCWTPADLWSFPWYRCMVGQCGRIDPSWRCQPSGSNRLSGWYHGVFDPCWFRRRMAFKIMETVRKGQWNKIPDDCEILTCKRCNNVPEWYIDSCSKIIHVPESPCGGVCLDGVAGGLLKVYFQFSITVLISLSGRMTLIWLLCQKERCRKRTDARNQWQRNGCVNERKKSVDSSGISQWNAGARLWIRDDRSV